VLVALADIRAESLRTDFEDPGTFVLFGPQYPGGHDAYPLFEIATGSALEAEKDLA
jgi:hypothetical protein